MSQPFLHVFDDALDEDCAVVLATSFGVSTLLDQVRNLLACCLRSLGPVLLDVLSSLFQASDCIGWGLLPKAVFELHDLEQTTYGIQHVCSLAFAVDAWRYTLSTHRRICHINWFHQKKYEIYVSDLIKQATGFVLKVWCASLREGVHVRW